MRVAVTVERRLEREALASVLSAAGFATTTHTTVQTAEAALGGTGVLVLQGGLDPDLVHVASLRPGVHTVVVQRDLADGDVTKALAAGAVGFITAAASARALVEAVAAAATGAPYVDRAATSALVAAHRGTTGKAKNTVSRREKQTLELVARGLTNPEIAAELGLGTQTVKTHLARVYRKLGVTDRASALYQAIQDGILT